MSAGLSLGAYLLGLIVLLAIAGPLAYAAIVARRVLLPAWSGAPARLAESILFLCLLLWSAEAVGAIGLFNQLPLILTSLLIGIGAHAVFTRVPPAGGGKGGSPSRRDSAADGGVPSRQDPRAERSFSSRIPYALAALAAALVVAAWAIPLAQSFAGGITGVDSMWYHLPQSASFVQTGSVWGLHFTDPYFLNWYYPANSELLHALPLLAFGSDWLSPLVNHAFLALGLLAAWCIGRPWGVGSQAMIAAAIVFGAEMTIDFQPGEARNDALGLALFLAAIAILANGANRRRPSPPLGVGTLVVAGLAAGLAVGTKLTLLAPVAGLAVGVAILAGRGRRLRDGMTFLAAIVAGGGFWYVRNLIHSGNPLPWIDSLGPISLPAPEVALELRPPFAVAHYLTDTQVWRDFFFPGLADSLGPLWPLILAITVGTAVVALTTLLRAGDREGASAVAPATPLRAGDREGESSLRSNCTGSEGVPSGQDPRAARLIPILGGIVLFTLLAYLVTPLTASGPEGHPEGFVWNLRYIAPALALGLILLPLLPRLRGPRASLAVAAGLFVVLVVQTAGLEVWAEGQEAWAAGSALVVLAGFAIGRGLATRPAGKAPPRIALAAGASSCAAIALAAGYVEQGRYAEDRYASALEGLRLDGAIAWADEAEPVRIGTAGRGGVFFQYGFSGKSSSNEVQWIGIPGPRGAWLPAESCREWREAANSGGYEFVVTTYDRRFPGTDETSREREWLRRDPAAEQILEQGPVTVYELTGALDPEGCGAPEAAAAERPTGVLPRPG